MSFINLIKEETVFNMVATINTPALRALKMTDIYSSVPMELRTVYENA
jgi:hypothetical protein